MIRIEYEAKRSEGTEISRPRMSDCFAALGPAPRPGADGPEITQRAYTDGICYDMRGIDLSDETTGPELRTDKPAT